MKKSLHFILIAACLSLSVSPIQAQTQSDPVIFTIDPQDAPKPTIASIVPSHIQAGGNFTLTVHGTNFIPTSVVTWTPTAAGSATTNLVTTFVDATQVTAAVPTSLMTAAGTANVTVLNPASSGGGDNGGNGGDGGDVVGLGHKVTLTWAQPAQDGCATPPCAEVAGYNIFRSEVKGGPYEIAGTTASKTATTFDDMWAAGGMTYYYVVASVSTNGGQSVFSNESKAVVPSDAKSGKKKPPKPKTPKHHE